MVEPAALSTPRYVQADVLKITRLKPEMLQTWSNREIVKLSDQNPGSGRRRLYSSTDVVKLAIMRRMADLRIDLSVSKELAEAAADDLLAGHSIEWDLYIHFNPRDATADVTKYEIIQPSDMPKLSKFGGLIGDPIDTPVSQYVENFAPGITRRESRRTHDHMEAMARGEELSENPPIVPERRVALAKHGFHAEPVIIFPIGEIVNGTLVQLEAHDAEKAKEAEAGGDTTA